MILHSFADIGTILFLSGVSILITLSAIELMTHKDIDVDQELKLTGITNVASGLLGGVVAFHSMSLTGLGMRLGGHNRLVGLVAASVCAGGFFAGPDVLSYLPRPLLGGILTYLGISFLREWLLQARNKLPLAEYLLIPLILLVIIIWGFLPGLMVGLLLAVVLFVVHYSRIGAVRFAISGANWKSIVERHPKHEAFLKTNGDRIYIIALHGYLFFGTTRKLLAQLQQQMRDGNGKKPEYVLFDFRYVVGIDYSAAINFVKIAQFAEQHNLVVVFSGLSDRFRSRLINSGIDVTNRESIRFFTDMDHGFEWCENRILDSQECEADECGGGVFEEIASRLADKTSHHRFMEYFERMEVPAGHVVIAQGDSAEDLYFLEQGEVSVYLDTEKGERMRLRKTEQGTVIGEIGFYLDGQRTASVLTDKASVLYRLSKAAMSRMEQEEPTLALEFHRFMAEFSSLRLSNTTQSMSRLLE
jgi:SulP family sulfate permease